VSITNIRYTGSALEVPEDALASAGFLLVDLRMIPRVHLDSNDALLQAIPIAAECQIPCGIVTNSIATLYDSVFRPTRHQKILHLIVGEGLEDPLGFVSAVAALFRDPDPGQPEPDRVMVIGPGYHTLGDAAKKVGRIMRSQQ
jgi:hypothetical protein